ncbi:hypothetical protein ACIBEK_19450 [Nocardia fusca]
MGCTAPTNQQPPTTVLERFRVLFRSDQQPVTTVLEEPGEEFFENMTP